MFEDGFPLPGAQVTEKKVSSQEGKNEAPGTWHPLDRGLERRIAHESSDCSCGPPRFFSDNTEDVHGQSISFPARALGDSIQTPVGLC